MTGRATERRNCRATHREMAEPTHAVCRSRRLRKRCHATQRVGLFGSYSRDARRRIDDGSKPTVFATYSITRATKSFCLKLDEFRLLLVNLPCDHCWKHFH